jgi:hypothetical protein
MTGPLEASTGRDTKSKRERERERMDVEDLSLCAVVTVILRVL